MDKNKTAHQGRGAEKIEYAIAAIIFAVLSIACLLICLLFDMEPHQRLGNLMALSCSAFQFSWYLRAWIA